MSADNYVACPSCVRTGRSATNHVSNPLREYYGVGITPEGLLEVEYRCKCSECGWEWEHEFSPVTAPGFKGLTGKASAK